MQGVKSTHEAHKIIKNTITKKISNSLMEVQYNYWAHHNDLIVFVNEKKIFYPKNEKFPLIKSLLK